MLIDNINNINIIVNCPFILKYWLLKYYFYDIVYNKSGERQDRQ